MHKWTKIFRWPRYTSEVDEHVSSPKDERDPGLYTTSRFTVFRHDVLVCNLQIAFNNEELLTITFDTKWAKNKAFQALNDEAIRNLEQNIELGTRTLFLRYGRCRIVTLDAGEKFHQLRNQSQWPEAIGKAFLAVLMKIRQDHPRLDVRLEYSAIQLEPINGQCYAQTLRNEIKLQMQANFENRFYVLLNEFIGLLSVAGLQRLLQEDESLRSSVENDILFVDKFVRDIAQSARKLLALCVFTGLPLLFLKVMRDQGFSDDHLPLRPEQCSGKLTPVDFNLLVSEQWAFLPHRFTRQRNLLRLESKCIVPMCFDSDLDKVGVGSYSNLYRVSINQACHDFSSVSLTPYLYALIYLSC